MIITRLYSIIYIYPALQKLGCDGIVSSSKVVDDCGICDGDGTFCQEREPTLDKHVYQWDVRWTFCSVSCGVSQIQLYTGTEPGLFLKGHYSR